MWNKFIHYLELSAHRIFIMMFQVMTRRTVINTTLPDAGQTFIDPHREGPHGASYVLFFARTGNKIYYISTGTGCIPADLPCLELPPFMFQSHLSWYHFWPLGFWQVGSPCLVRLYIYIFPLEDFLVLTALQPASIHPAVSLPFLQRILKSAIWWTHFLGS